MRWWTNKGKPSHHPSRHWQNKSCRLSPLNLSTKLLIWRIFVKKRNIFVRCFFKDICHDLSSYPTVKKILNFLWFWEKSEGMWTPTRCCSNSFIRAKSRFWQDKMWPDSNFPSLPELFSRALWRINLSRLFSLDRYQCLWKKKGGGTATNLLFSASRISIKIYLFASLESQLIVKIQNRF